MRRCYCKTVTVHNNSFTVAPSHLTIYRGDQLNVDNSSPAPGTWVFDSSNQALGSMSQFAWKNKSGAAPIFHPFTWKCVGACSCSVKLFSSVYALMQQHTVASCSACVGYITGSLTTVMQLALVCCVCCCVRDVKSPVDMSQNEPEMFSGPPFKVNFKGFKGW